MGNNLFTKKCSPWICSDTSISLSLSLSLSLSVGLHFPILPAIHHGSTGASVYLRLLFPPKSWAKIPHVIISLSTAGSVGSAKRPWSVQATRAVRRGAEGQTIFSPVVQATDLATPEFPRWDFMWHESWWYHPINEHEWTNEPYRIDSPRTISVEAI